MHAASVHPEPGSNSRMFVFNLAYASSNHFECYLSFSYFCLSCICSLRNFRVPFLHILLCLYFSLRCSIFNDRLLPVFATALLLYHFHFALSTLFLKKVAVCRKHQNKCRSKHLDCAQYPQQLNKIAQIGLKILKNGDFIC